jgi:hypothetical protein
MITCSAYGISTAGIDTFSQVISIQEISMDLNSAFPTIKQQLKLFHGVLGKRIFWPLGEGLEINVSNSGRLKQEL